MSIVVQDLIVTHGSRTLVDVAGIRLQRGRPVTLVGASGSGKSLLAHAVMGTLAGNLAARGRMDIDGTAHDLGDPRWQLDLLRCRGGRPKSWQVVWRGAAERLELDEDGAETEQRVVRPIRAAARRR